MPLTLAPPPITESLDTGELVIPAPPLYDTAPATVVVESQAFSPSELSISSIDITDHSILATLSAILVGVWLIRMILSLIPQFLVFGVGIAILYAYIK